MTALTAVTRYQNALWYVAPHGAVSPGYNSRWLPESTNRAIAAQHGSKGSLEASRYGDRKVLCSVILGTVRYRITADSVAEEHDVRIRSADRR